MSHRVVGAFAISLTLSAAHARAQDDKQEGDAAKPATTDAAKAAEEEEEEEEAAKPAAQAEVKAEIGATAEAKVDAPDVEADPQHDDAHPLYGKRSQWSLETYGYARFDAIIDSTQSFDDGLSPWLIQRAGTYRGDHARAIFTARDSRVGFKVKAPEYSGLRSSAVLELDFYGLTISDAKKHDQVVFGPLRIRHAYAKLETDIVDVIAGQTYDVFGWGGTFYPATVGYLGVPGQIYHRTPQLRVEKTINAGGLAVTPAVAAVKPGQRDNGGFPDVQGGIKLSLDQWKGAAHSGFGPADIKPISVGISGVFRHFEVPVFKLEPGSEAQTTNGYGIAAQVLLPVIPAVSTKDKANALTLTGEFSLGTGIAELHGGMDGGSRLPVVTDPSMLNPAPAYPQNIDPGLLTFDRELNAKTINWKAFVAGGQYHLPVGNGSIWLGGVYSRVWSDNIKKLTPAPNWGGIFTKAEFIDVSVGFELTPALMIGLAGQTLKQTFADMSPPKPVAGQVSAVGTPGTAVQPGTGNVPATARHNRGMFTMALFF
jgi:hypothetical protein